MLQNGGHAYDHDHGVAFGDDDPGADVGVIAWHQGPDLQRLVARLAHGHIMAKVAVQRSVSDGRLPTAKRRHRRTQPRWRHGELLQICCFFCTACWV